MGKHLLFLLCCGKHSFSRLLWCSKKGQNIWVKLSFSASVHYEVDWGVERVLIPDILWMHSKPRNIILVTADWAGVTMYRQWSAGKWFNHVAIIINDQMWCDEKIHFPSYPSVIQITPIVLKCSHEHYPMKLLVLVEDMNGRRRGHDHVCGVVNCIDIE